MRQRINSDNSFQTQEQQIRDQQALRDLTELGQAAVLVRNLLNNFLQEYQADLVRKIKAPKCTPEDMLVLRGELVAADSFSDYLQRQIVRGETAMQKLSS